MRWLTTLLILSILLVGCGGKAAPIPPQTCVKTVDFGVWDLKGERIYTDSVSMSLEVKPKTDRLFSVAFVDKAEMERYNAAISKMEAQVAKANADLSALFAQTTATTVPLYRWANSGSPNIYGETGWPDDACRAGSYYVSFGGWGEYLNSSFDYRTYPKVIGDMFYVTVSRPGKSWIQYSFPAEWFNQIVRSNFLDEGAPDLSLVSQVSSQPAKTQLDDQAFEASMLASVAGNLEEVVSFRFSTGDFQGRKEMRPVIIKALQLARIQHSNAEFLYVAKFASEAQAFARVSFTGDDFHLSGWKSLFGGELRGSGGGSSGQGTYSESTTEFLEGSIFIIPSDNQ